MKCYRAVCKTTDVDNWTIDEKGYLRDEFDKKALLFPYRFRRGQRDEDDALRFCVSLLCSEWSVDEGDAKEYVLEACRLWDIPHPSMVEVEECTFSTCLIDDSYSYASAAWFNEGRLCRIANLSELRELMRYPLLMVERLLGSPLPKSEAFERLQRTRYVRALEEELSRVYAEPARKGGTAALAPIIICWKGRARLATSRPWTSSWRLSFRRGACLRAMCSPWIWTSSTTSITDRSRTGIGRIR